MDVRPDAIATIIGMALITYGVRAGGLWLMGRVKPTPRIEAWLRHIPGAVLVSLIAPAALASSPAEALATLATAVVALRTANLLLAMVIGVLSVWLLRMVF